MRHVLLDADGVLQEGTAPFRSALSEAFGEDPGEWLRDTFRPEGDVLTGRVEVVPLLTERLTRLGRSQDAQQLYDATWLQIAPHPPVVDLAGRLRAAGHAVHLATNQDPGRTAYMKQALGYDRVLDRSFYSSDLGVAKPAAGFFEAILTALGAAPEQVCFVDDMATNVAGAREVGIAAVQWEIAEGVPTLEVRLADLGVRAGEPGTS